MKYFSIRISRMDNCGIALRFPTNKYMVAEAKQLAGITNEHPEYTIGGASDTPTCVVRTLHSQPAITLSELQYFGERWAEMDDHQQDKLEAIAAHQSIHSMRELIDATYNLEKYDFYPGIKTAMELGKHTIYNPEVFPLLEDCPEAVLNLLSAEALGKKLAAIDGGQFTTKGYLIPLDREWTHGYDPALLPDMDLTPDDPLVRIKIRANYNSPSSGWINLPATDKELQQAAQAVGKPNATRCEIIVTQSVVYALNNDRWDMYNAYFDEIQAINQVAQKLVQIPPQEIPKLNAILEHGHDYHLNTIQEAICSLDEYAFCQAGDMTELGRKLLQMKGITIPHELEDFTDLYALGQHYFYEYNGEQTVYGFIFDDEGLLSELCTAQAQQTGQDEPRNDQPQEPTMAY